MRPRPPDECPYRKPFRPDFDECTAFQPREFIPLDTLYQPLQPVLTCRHLTTRTLPHRSHWYAACVLGDAQARRRWADDLGLERLERIRGLQRRLGEVMAQYALQLWELKGRQLRAIRDGEETAATNAELALVADHSMSAMGTFLDANHAAFAEVDLPVAAVHPCRSRSLDREPIFQRNQLRGPG